jgi:aspartate/tyrosine/aromatic aminotransferase
MAGDSRRPPNGTDASKVSGCVQGRVAVLQSLSGTGSLRVGAAFIQAWLPGKTMYISNPTWGNHRNIFSDAGLEWKYYRCTRFSPWLGRLHQRPLLEPCLSTN